MRVPLRVAATVGELDFVTRLRQTLYAHGGRWAAIVVAPPGRIYVDPMASLPVLFDPQTGTLASSPFLLLDPDGTIADSPLVDEVAVYRTGRFYPLGATSHARARLVLPSHEVDLATFEQTRTWPAGPLQRVDPADAVGRIAHIIDATVAAVASEGNAVLPLTAGGDSRMLLACARPVVDQLTLFTVRYPDTTGRTDARRAADLAARYQLPHGSCRGCGRRRLTSGGGCVSPERSPGSPSAAVRGRRSHSLVRAERTSARSLWK